MNYPKHVALIPDGNRTWAKENGLPKLIGHKNGYKRVKEIIQYLFSYTPVNVFTVWGMSTENLKKRENSEMQYIFDFVDNFTSDMQKFFEDNKINFRFAGSSDGIPTKTLSFLNKLENDLCFADSNKAVVLCMNYGGRDEILRGINSILKSTDNLNEISEDMLTNSLDFAGLDTVDLVIRTKGDMAQRTSGFMSWWIGYAELYFTPLKCPDFTVEKIEQALNRYNDVYEFRNFGK